jgi:hypothetical protein
MDLADRLAGLAPARRHALADVGVLQQEPEQLAAGVPRPADHGDAKAAHDTASGMRAAATA